MSDNKVKGRAGALALAKSMTPEEKKARAKLGALARWADKPIRALRKGSFEDEFGIDVDCYVIDDEQKTAVISQTGMASALGLSARGSAFPSFIGSQAIASSIGSELRGKLEKTLLIQWGSGGSEQPGIVIHGHEASLLIDVCNAIADAQRKGKLGKRYQKVVQQAAIINGASAKSGIKGLVYALTGYRPEVEQVIEAFKVYVLEEAKKYEKEFPIELYAEWQRLYSITPPARGKNWKEMWLTIDHVYYPLAKSNGKLLGLLRTAKASNGDRGTRLFSFLNEVGARALRIHLGRILEMAESSTTREQYEKKVRDRFGDQSELNL